MKVEYKDERNSNGRAAEEIDTKIA